jgi:hypothetical protein
MATVQGDIKAATIAGDGSTMSCRYLYRVTKGWAWSGIGLLSANGPETCYTERYSSSLSTTAN